MSGAVINLSQEGDAEWARKLATIDDYTPGMERVGVLFLGVIDRRFAENGPGWAPLAASTVAQKAARGRSAGNILQDTGQLHQSFQRGQENERGGQNIFDVQPRSIEVGSNDPVALWMDEGTKPHEIFPKSEKALFWVGAAHPYAKVNHPGTVPRPIAVISAEDASDAAEVVADYILEVGLLK